LAAVSTAADDRQQARREVGDQRGEVAFQLVDPPGQRPAAAHQLPGQVGDQPGCVVQGAVDVVEHPHAAQPAGADLEGGRELAQVPTQPALDPGPLSDQVVAVVDQQPHPAGRAVQARHWQVGFAQRGPGHGQRVDRVGLATLAPRAPGGGHQPGRHPQDLFPGAQQVGLQPAGQVPAVLGREDPLGPPGRPPQRVHVPVAGGRQGALGELPAGLINRHERVGLLVGVDTDDDHADLLDLLVGTGPGRSAGKPQSRQVRLLSSHTDQPA